MAPPSVTEAERARFFADKLDTIYRVERQWRILGVVLSLLGAAVIWAGYRASGATVIALSLPCQFISWAAMAAARKVHDAQRAVPR